MTGQARILEPQEREVGHRAGAGNGCSTDGRAKPGTAAAHGRVALKPGVGQREDGTRV